ncbi:MTHFR-domain-containing protein [Fomitiporia mediterranea MF3/22]|uniref:MTHFR-domain-containing protein n=1 Tax=Fomitiporia mediterranea (strain MF3/22) TaxID=694068 RepID=UPI0004407A6B|nr:MTHFR-domain-containing protein [Fomitiporia mediterranea MF3/22]EJD02262.1 MTHFR-domain-containing protein [Fomitiporia mediterranea MF3/22]
MKLSDKIAQHTSSRPFFTFEFFPPRTDEGFANLLTRVSRMSELDPLAVSVTWGAGGTTKDRSLELAEIIQTEHAIDTLMHLTCTNMEQGLVDDVLRKAKERGIENILALRGDPPRGEEYWIPIDPRFTHAIDLVKYIKSSPEFSSSFCIGVAAYPDGYVESDVDEDTELEYLKAKVDAGAEFIITQLFYDVGGFLKWLRKVREKGINVPVIPGIMPLQNYATFLRLTKLCGTKVPSKLKLDLEPLRHDDQKVKDYGVTLAMDIIRRLIDSGDVSGVHFCTLNLERSVRKVLEGLQWIGGPPKHENRLIVDPADEIQEPPEFTIKPHDAAQTATDKLSTKPLPDIPEPGKGEVNNASTWDEFPNGRFGDSKSPAFGLQLDPWNSGVPNSLGVSVTRWGNPKSPTDLTNLFLAHLHSKLSSTPFSPYPLLHESQLILKHLEDLTRRGWWTVFSQPAVDGVSSSDEVFGWGPAGGYVFQKGFVEFFAVKEDVELLERKIRCRGDGWVDFFAANEKGELRTNVPESGRNAVTWGVFAGQEIAQSTIIDRTSFLSWKEEAFSIWEQWSLVYPPDSAERRFLESVRSERWLVSIVHHDFKDSSKLWSFILDE